MLSARLDDDELLSYAGANWGLCEVFAYEVLEKANSNRFGIGDFFYGLSEKKQKDDLRACDFSYNDSRFFQLHASFNFSIQRLHFALHNQYNWGHMEWRDSV